VGTVCEGQPDEIQCLETEIGHWATYLTTPPQDCGNGVIDVGEACEEHSQCGPTGGHCVECQCFFPVCS
jgi:hypothetical protein